MCLEIEFIFIALCKVIIAMATSPRLTDLIYELKKRCVHIDQQLLLELKISQSELLFFLSVGNCQTISSPELAKQMDLSLSRVSRVVETLVVNGYLDRQTDSNDRRAIRLCLTPSGKLVKSKIEKARQACENRLLKSIPPADLEQFEQLFANLLAHL